MSESNGKSDKSAKTKSPIRTLNLLNPGNRGNTKPQIRPLVPPVLKQVRNLAVRVASVSTSASGSATGNPRNKVALSPGHSLMDWIRLGSSGKDLTGVGPKAGHLSVTKQELAKHNTKEDAWLAIRGKVYNVTEYMSFHPGGEDELLRGAGIDSTTLFQQVHPWVNYEQILQKCLIGNLVAVDPNVDTEALFFGETRSSSSAKSNTNLTNSNTLEVSPINSTATSLPSDPKPSEPQNIPTPPLPRFDWIQKLDYISVIFYTKPFSNPFIEIQYPSAKQTVMILLTYHDTIFKNELTFFNKVRWPCDVMVSVESGKVELVFRKSESGVWDNYGFLRQQTQSVNTISVSQIKSNYVLTKKCQINHNNWLLKFEREDNAKIVIPVGKHVRVFGTGEEFSRSYTPVPECLFEQYLPFKGTKDNLCLMVKRYPDGKMSTFITEKAVGEKILMSRPIGCFELKDTERREIFLMLAGGSGITPMLGLMLFLLERRIKKCQFMRLLFFNRSERDIPFREKLDNLAKMDKRFKTINVLSEPDDSWTGYKGHVESDLVDNALQEHLKDTGYTIRDIFAFVCGPPKFIAKAMEVLESLKFTKNQIHKFDG